MYQWRACNKAWVNKFFHEVITAWYNEAHTRARAEHTDEKILGICGIFQRSCTKRIYVLSNRFLCFLYLLTGNIVKQIMCMNTKTRFGFFFVRRAFLHHWRSTTLLEQFPGRAWDSRKPLYRCCISLCKYPWEVTKSRFSPRSIRSRWMMIHYVTFCSRVDVFPRLTQLC